MQAEVLELAQQMEASSNQLRHVGAALIDYLSRRLATYTPLLAGASRSPE